MATVEELRNKYKAQFDNERGISGDIDQDLMARYYAKKEEWAKAALQTQQTVPQTPQQPTSTTADEQRVQGKLDAVTSEKRTKEDILAEIKSNPNALKDRRSMTGDYLNKGMNEFGRGVSHTVGAVADQIRNNVYDPVTNEHMERAREVENKKPLFGNTLFPTKEDTRNSKIEGINGADVLSKSPAALVDKILVNNAIKRGDDKWLENQQQGATKLREQLNKDSLEESTHIEEKYKNADPTKKAIAQLVGEGVGGALPAMGLALATGGSMGLLASGVSGAGHAYNTAKQDGATSDQAFNNAVLSGTATVAIERLFGGIPLLGKGVLNVKGIGSLAKNKAGQAILIRAAESLGEGFEEGLEAIIQPHLQALTYGKEVDYSALPSEVGKNMLGGAVVGGILGGTGDVVNGINTARANKNVNNLMANAPNAVAKSLDDIDEVQKAAVAQESGFATADEMVSEVNKAVQQQVVDYSTKLNVNTYIDNAARKTEGMTEFEKYAPVNNADEISKILGVDVTGYEHAIREKDVRHFLANLQNTVEDIKQIPDIIANPDLKIKGNNTATYFDDMKLSNNPTIYYVKRHNGVTYYLEQVIEENGILATKQFKKIPTGSMPKFIDKLPYSASEIKEIKEKITKLSLSQYGDVPIKSSPPNTSETEPLSINESFVNTNISQPTSNVNISQQMALNSVDNAIKTENPLQIANLTPEMANTTPQLNRGAIHEGNSTSRTAQTLKGYTAFDDTFKHAASKDKGITTYDGITNEETMKNASKSLDEGGIGRVAKWYSDNASSPENIATGIILMQRYQDIGDYENMINVMNHIRTMSTQGAQSIQLMSLLGRMTPEGMTYYAQKTLSDAYTDIVQGKTQKWINNNADKFKLSNEDIDFIKAKTEQAARLPNGRDKNILLGEVAARIQNKIPPTTGQSIKALARISMLLNPKTNVRNILGNAVVAPQHMVSDFIGTAVDKAIAEKTGVRTTGLPKVNSLQGFKKGVYESFEDFRKGINTRVSSGDRFEIGQGQNFGGKTKLGKSLIALDRVTNFLLDVGDRPFYETWFINSLNNQMSLNKFKQPTAEMIDIATTEALQRTWQDSNKYTSAVQKVRNSLNDIPVVGKYGLGDMIMPFIKTPANLTKAIVDFSPIGLAKALSYDSIKFSRAVRTGQVTPQMQKMYVKNLSQGITGVLVYAIAATLANQGLLKGGRDKDKDVASFMRNVMGEQPNSIKVGDTSYSYAWAQPLAGTAAISADIVNSLKAGAPKEYFAAGSMALANTILTAVQSGGSVLYEQSFLQGIQTLFSKDDFFSGLMELAFGEPSKFTPQFLGQIAQLADDTQRVSHAYNQPLETAVNKVYAKTPGLSQTLEPVVDVFGRDVKRNGSDNSIFNVFFNPANVAKENRTPATDEVYNIYKETGDKQVIPPVAPYHFEVSGKKYTMTSKQRTEYQRTTGKIAEKEINNFLNSEHYNTMDSADKAELLKDVYSYATAIAKSKVSDYVLSATNDKIYKASQNGIQPYEYLTLKSRMDTDGNNSVSQDEARVALDNSNLSEIQKAYMWHLQNSKWKSNPYD